MLNLAVCTLLLMVLDVVSGYVKHVIAGDVSSTKMRIGLLHKSQSILMLVAAYVLHFFGGNYVEGTALLPYAVGGYIITMEITSIAENLGFGDKLINWIGGEKTK